MKTRLLFVVLLTALSVAGCSKKTLVQDAIQEKYPDQIVFLPTGSEQALVMTFNDNWTLTAPSWVSCSKTSGAEGTYWLQVSTSVNRTGMDNAGVLRFDCSDGSVVSLPVIQDHPYLKLSITDDGRLSYAENSSNDMFLRFNWNDAGDQGSSAVTVKVESNVDWRFDFSNLSTPEEEFELSEDHGFGSAELKLFPKRKNLDRAAYECLLTADAYMPGEEGGMIGEGVDRYAISLHQNNLRFLINDQVEDADGLVDELGVESVGFDVDSELPWSVSGSTGWASLTTTAGDAGITHVVIKADGVNPTREERIQDIVLHSSGGADRVIRFHQSPFIFDVDQKSVTFDNAGTNTVTLNLSASGPWEVSVPEWLTGTPSGQEGNGQLVLTCNKQNLELEDVVGAVRFTSQLNGLEENAKVTQDAFLFEIIPDETLQKIPALSQLNYAVQVKSSGAWSLSASQPWVFMSTKSGNAEETIQLGANSINPDMNSDRKASVTFVSETHKAHGITLTKEIPLTQTKFLFKITPSETEFPAYTTKSQPLVLDIVCSSEWEIVSYPTWLVPETKSGSFDQKIAFSLAANTDKSKKRTGTIRVLSKYNSVYLTTSTLSQDKFVFSVDQTAFDKLSPVNAGQKSFSINCTKDVPWEIVSDGDWLTVNSASGTGSSSVTVTPGDNPLTSARKASVSITNKVSKEKLSVSFSQQAFVFSVSGSSYSFSEIDSSQNTFTVDCSSDWTIDTGGASWLTLSPASGTGKQQVTLSVKNNVETSTREATFTVYSNLQRGTSNELKKSFKVSQAAYKFDSSAKTFANLDALNEVGTSQTVSITCSGEWYVDSSVDWLKFNATSGKGNGTLRVTPTTNTSLSERSTTFSIVSKDNPNLKKPVTISQKAYIFSADTQKMEFTASAGGKICNIKSTAKWTVKADQTWITLSTKEGSGNQSLTVNVTKNDTNTDRSGKVTITSQYGNHVLTIDVTQAKP